MTNYWMNPTVKSAWKWTPESDERAKDARELDRKSENMIMLDEGDYGTYLIVDMETGEDFLVQTDWEYPGTAMSFGWSPCHGETDGTVDCPVCGKTASAMIAEAREYLDDHIGCTADDPGYFIN